MPRTVRGLLLVLLLVLAGCKSQGTRPYHEPPPPDIKSTVLDYADSDAFDTLLESALVNQDPVIVIRTHHPKPDWEARLNAWIAAWNQGGKVEAPGRQRQVRLQAPGVAVNADSIREFRLLIDDLMGKVENLAARGSSWWAEERVRAYRVALLKPYNLRFHLDDDQMIQIILFNGQYSRYYREYVQSLTTPDDESTGEWSRCITCSRSKNARGQGE
jgi:hypothetical protein